MKRSKVVTLVLISSALVSGCRSSCYSDIWQYTHVPTLYPFDPSDISVEGYDAYVRSPDSLHHHYSHTLRRAGFGHYGAHRSCCS